MPRRVLITGASRGIGKAIAEVYRREGWETLTPTREQLDVDLPKMIINYRIQVGAVDVLVNNAGHNPLEQPGSRDTFQTNYDGTRHLMIQFIPKMVQNSWGRIVNVSSCSAFFGRGVRRAEYGASKAGVDCLTRAYASEYGRANVLVNSICPGFVDTDMTRRNLTTSSIEKICASLPVGRLALPQEIAEFVYFLGSEKNTYITGQVIPIDGGYTSCR